VATWDNTLTFYLSGFPTITYILNTEGLLSDPSVLIAFMKNPVASQVFYTLLLSVNNTHTAAHNEITINQNQLQLTNKQLCDITE
jgi:hypothetical protein